MIVKVNRVKAVNEIQELLSAGVDIIGMSLKLSKTNLDTRAIELDEILRIQKVVKIPNLSLNLNIEEYYIEDIVRASETIKPNSLNLFIDASSIQNLKELSKAQLDTIETINQTGIKVICFGNGFGYDGPASIPDTLEIYENLQFMEVNFDTLDSNSKHQIKSRKEWAEYLRNAESQIKQSNCDTILESITESMNGRAFLVDDRNLENVQLKKLIEIGANGITLSLKGESDDVNNVNSSVSNRITNTFELGKIIEITKRLKYGS